MEDKTEHLSVLLTADHKHSIQTLSLPIVPSLPLHIFCHHILSSMQQSDKRTSIRGKTTKARWEKMKQKRGNRGCGRNLWDMVRVIKGWEGTGEHRYCSVVFLLPAFISILTISSYPKSEYHL